MAWKFDSDRPVYVQIAQRITLSILSGEYYPGQQIPTVRQLAVEAMVNPNTVQRSFSFLESQGLVISQGTQGRFVTHDLEKIEEHRRRVAEETIHDLIEKAKLLKLSRERLLEMIKEADE